jgi:hypothetical protein
MSFEGKKDCSNAILMIAVDLATGKPLNKKIMRHTKKVII